MTYFHQHYLHQFEKNNVVMMLRQPVERFLSEYAYDATQIIRVTQYESQLRNSTFFRDFITKRRIGNLQTAFLLGSSNLMPQPTSMPGAIDDGVARAFTVLKSKLVFYGITNYWGLSVCLFHCELGGLVNAAVECQDTRRGFRDKVLLDMSRESRFVEPYVRYDIKLFHLARTHFFERVGRCRCVDVCAPNITWIPPPA